MLDVRNFKIIPMLPYGGIKRGSLVGFLSGEW
jgi:hypothetical protein